MKNLVVPDVVGKLEFVVGKQVTMGMEDSLCLPGCSARVVELGGIVGGVGHVDRAWGSSFQWPAALGQNVVQTWLSNPMTNRSRFPGARDTAVICCF